LCYRGLTVSTAPVILCGKWSIKYSLNVVHPLFMFGFFLSAETDWKTFRCRSIDSLPIITFCRYLPTIEFKNALFYTNIVILYNYLSNFTGPLSMYSLLLLWILVPTSNNTAGTKSRSFLKTVLTNGNYYYVNRFSHF